MFTITMNNKQNTYENKITLNDLAKEFKEDAIVAKVDNRLRELNYYINYNCEVELLNLSNFDAVRVYETSLRYLIIMALENLHPGIMVRFNQCISRSLSCTILSPEIKVSKVFLESLEKEMERLVSLDLPIQRNSITKAEAKNLYTQKGYHDKVEVLHYREDDKVNFYKCGDYCNYMFGYMVPRTGLLSKFKLKIYLPGFIVQFPRAECGGEIPEFDESPAFGKMIIESQKWSEMCKCNRVPLLNQYATQKSVVDLVSICETKHNNMLAELGAIIKDNSDNIRLICIAGPSSSGKTTFSHRLRIELMSKGLKPIKISMDDYYNDKASCPRDENGELDLEHVNALDLELFNEHLLSLIQGEEIAQPVFDFRIGKRIPGAKLKIDEDTIVIIEGIHALNEDVTKLIPKHQKFKIYISPLSQINIDNHNPISATEIRLLRRIVRDKKYRKTDPSATFAMWPSVRRGEFRWIYPYQEEADFVFNTELTYELGVMKKYAIDALNSIGRNDEYFIQANRLVKFLKYIRDIDDRYVPCNSLLREFIGESCFYDD